MLFILSLHPFTKAPKNNLPILMHVCQTLIPSPLCGDLVGVHVAKDTTGIIDTGLCQNQGSLLTSWPVIICSCFSIFPCNGYFAICDHLHRSPSKLDLMLHFPRIKPLKMGYVVNSSKITRIFFSFSILEAFNVWMGLWWGVMSKDLSS